MFPSFWPAALVIDLFVWSMLFVCNSIGIAPPKLLKNTRQRQRPATDEQKPTTTVSVRLAAGSRVQAKFNQDTHTVADIRRFIEFEMVQAMGSATDIDTPLPTFELVSGFPPKALEEGTPAADGVTLQEAGLLNAAITQRLKQLPGPYAEQARKRQ